jgi:hypothetical protein
MENFSKRIRKKIDWVLIIIGSYMITSGIFSFGHSTTSYYYTLSTTRKIGIGAVLLVWGILIYKEKVNKKHR